MIRIPFPDDTSRDAFDDAALATGLALLNILPRTDTQPAHCVYVTSDHRALVYFVDAEPSAFAWVVRAEGDTGAETDVEERWAGVLRAAMGGAAP